MVHLLVHTLHQKLITQDHNMDKYKDYVRAVREIGVEPLPIGDFESLLGAMDVNDIISLTVKASGNVDKPIGN
jgi:hypothetical protein